MTSWKSALKADPTDWLLEPDNPSVRYFTLREICDGSDNDKEVSRARADIMRLGTVPEILKNQDNGGWWESPNSFYMAKYAGTVWQLLILAELGADGTDERIRKGCEFILEHSQDRESHGFAVNASAKSGGGRHSEVIPCLSGNMVWSLIRLGRSDDERVRSGIDFLNRYRRFDDGDGPAPEGWPYDKYEICWGRHTCHMGVVKTLKALAEIPENARDKATRKTIAAGVEYLLSHHVFKKSHDLSSVSKPGWLKFGFPLMYQTDALEIMMILTELGCHDERMTEAFDRIVAKQDKNGRWTLENSYNDRMHVQIERKGKLSKWVTLHALRVLKRLRHGK